MSQRILAGYLVFVALSAPAVSATAWNIRGHMLSAVIAHQILQHESPQTIEKVNTVLTQHPWRFNRWQNSFAVSAGSDAMLLMLAARWPDDIRTTDKAQQHQRMWHYINMPFKPAGQPAHIQTQPPDMPNVLTALEKNRRIAASDPDPQKRAVALATNGCHRVPFRSAYDQLSSATRLNLF